MTNRQTRARERAEQVLPCTCNAQDRRKWVHAVWCPAIHRDAVARALVAFAEEEVRAALQAAEEAMHQAAKERGAENVYSFMKEYFPATPALKGTSK